MWQYLTQQDIININQSITGRANIINAGALRAWGQYG